MLYDSFARFYDSFMSPLERIFLRRWRSELLSLLPAESRILEIGAGTGLNFEHYPDCSQAVASEFAYEMIAYSRRRAHRIDLVQTDAQSLPFPDDYFDAAFATLVFCSIPNTTEAFAELKRVVKPNGKILLLEHVRPQGLLGYVFDVLNYATVALIDDHFNRETAKLVKKAGIEVTEIRSKALSAVNLIICNNP